MYRHTVCSYTREQNYYYLSPIEPGQPHRLNESYQCPKCKRYGGRLSIRTETRKGAIKLDRNELPKMKKVVYHHGKVPEEGEVAISRKLHPWKFLSVFCEISGVKINENPYINPPYSRKGSPRYEGLREVSLSALRAQYSLYFTIPKILDKYPEIMGVLEEFDVVNEIIDCINLIVPYFKSISDRRNRRSLAEWSEIVNYANQTSVSQASRRFYGKEWNSGKKLYLNKKYIKQKSQTMRNLGISNEVFREKYCRIAILLQPFIKLIKMDEELQQEYEKNKRNFDLHVKRDRENTLGYQYEYFKIIHYDHNLYEKQKLEYQNGLRKTRPDGRIECRVKKSDIPSYVLTTDDLIR